MPSTALIISFYNEINYLKFIFAGLEVQNYTDFEVIIADDGSGREAIEQIEELGRIVPFQLKHVWQEDKGFRKNKILNKAVLSSSADHLIFIDGDCVPHSSFVKEHYIHGEEGVCYTGRRVNLSARITRHLSEKKIKSGYLEHGNIALIEDSLFGKTTDAERGIYTSSKIIRKIVNRKKRGLLGCNFSLFKNDLFKINGFDERYEAPSIGEDSDIQYRLELTGVKIKSLNNIAVQYHLNHKYKDRLQENLDLFGEVKKSGIAFTPHGINQEYTKMG